MRRRRGRPVHGWVVVDKPVGVTSTQVVGKVRRAFDADKVGHAGTLDPLATGVLPVALGEATKTVPFAQDGRKTYRFTVRFGIQTTTDDAEGEAIATTDARPTDAAIRAALPRFTGEITQVPPAFSALKVAGERAYDLARAGDAPDLAPRPATVLRFDLLDRPDDDHGVFEIVSGKGFYVRALARDLGIALGTRAHVSDLRRIAVGPFGLDRAVTLETLAVSAEPDGPDPAPHLLPVETALDDIPALALTDGEAQRLRQGRTVAILRKLDRSRLDRLGPDDLALATHAGRPVALVTVDGVELRPVRVLNVT